MGGVAAAATHIASVTRAPTTNGKPSHPAHKTPAAGPKKKVRVAARKTKRAIAAGAAKGKARPGPRAAKAARARRV